jgi:hypothetical protein
MRWSRASFASVTAGSLAPLKGVNGKLLKVNPNDFKKIAGIARVQARAMPQICRLRTSPTMS